jgi:uncharacterized protein (DUF1501 family)
MNTKNNNMNRRAFMKLLSKGSAAGALGSIGQFALMNEAFAASSAPNFPGYKALVCVYFHGGNDSFNMLIPTQADKYAIYKKSRGDLAVANNDLNLSSISNNLKNGTLGKGSSNPYNAGSAANESVAYTRGLYDLSNKGINLGVNGLMPEFAQLVNDNKISIISNIGNLVEPVTRQQIKDKTANLPLFLFAHDHQRRALQTGQGNNLNDIGWAGKIADSWKGINSNSPLGLNISYAGNDRMLIGKKTAPFVIHPGSIPYFKQMRKNHNSHEDDRRALFKALAGITEGSSASTLGLNKMNYGDENPFKRLYGKMTNKSLTTFDELFGAWHAPENEITYTSTGPYGEDLFANVKNTDIGFNASLKGNFISQMDSVAKMIDLGAKDAFNTGSYKRQIFFVNMTGFDNHTNQAPGHSKLLREMSLGLWKFQKAMGDLGHEEKVTTFSMSDFGRTLSSNSGGTDHAWGAHHFVMGGAGNKTSGTLNGGTMIGELPDLTLNGPDDYKDKGRIIPKLSQDQLNASICEWFGVEQSKIAEIFPNLSNFKSDPNDIKSAFLNNLFV